MRRIIPSFAVFFAAVLVGDPGIAAAQEVAPVVSITDTHFADTGLPDCPGHPGGPIVAGSVTFSRTGATDATLLVNYDVSGPVEAPHGIATFAGGSATSTIIVTPTVGGFSEVHVTIAGGDGYDIGAPATVRLTIRYEPIYPPEYCKLFDTTTTAPTTTTTTTTTTGTTAPSATTIDAQATPPRNATSATTGAAAAAAAATLPRTGANNSPALVAFAVSLIGAGGFLRSLRRRRTRA